MTDPVLPSWERDPLSMFLSDAQRNERVSSLKMPDLYALLRGVHAAFQQVATITEMEHNENLLLARFLMARTHSAWLAAPSQSRDLSVSRSRRLDAGTRTQMRRSVTHFKLVLTV